jgi:hypothetical protein
MWAETECKIGAGESDGGSNYVCRFSARLFFNGPASRTFSSSDNSSSRVFKPRGDDVRDARTKPSPGLSDELCRFGKGLHPRPMRALPEKQDLCRPFPKRPKQPFPKRPKQPWSGIIDKLCRSFWEMPARKDLGLHSLDVL